MILSQERFLEIQKISKEVSRITKRDLSLSETRSLCSDIPRTKLSWSLGGLKKISSRESIVLILQLHQMHRNWAFAIWMELYHLPKKFQYQGDWELVHQLLRNRTSLERQINTILEYGYSTSALFGMLMDKNLSRLKKINIYDPYRQKVVNPQRKRGYNDHGSRREDHKWLPWNAFSSPDMPKRDSEKELIDITPNFTTSIWHRIKTSLTKNTNHKGETDYEE